MSEATAALEALTAARFDWRDFEQAGSDSRKLLRALAADRQALRTLVLRVAEQECLLRLCERHQLLDYIVLHDAPQQGFRLRLHISTDDHFDRPHDHRFSFSSHILCGAYRHTGHLLRASPYKDGADEEAKRYISAQRCDPRGKLHASDIEPMFSRDEIAGGSYSLHHKVVHTTFTTPDTVSLFLRGPAEKDRSIIIDRLSGNYWWRFGQQNEPALRRQEKQMTAAAYHGLCERLSGLGVI